MGSRLDLHTLLLSASEIETVYFQPAPSFTMAYPCIVYKPDDAKTAFADNVPYRYTKRYMITVMDKDADSVIPDKIGQLPQCVYNRFYVANNLYHHVFLMYY